MRKDGKSTALAVLAVLLVQALAAPATAGSLKSAAQPRVDPVELLPAADELPPGFIHQINRDEDRTTSNWSHATRVYWRFNPEVAPDDITSLHVSATVYDSVVAASQAMRDVYPELLRNFQSVESTDMVGEEAFQLWQAIPEVGPRQAEAWYILFRVGPVVARSRWGDYDDLPNYNHAVDLARQLEAKIRQHFP